ncbi:MAG: NAD-dependent epimerase/dehydratase family protein [Caldilineaceae bacterium]
MKVLFIGGTGIISSACTQRALTKGIDLYHLNRAHQRLTPDGVTVLLSGDIRDTASAQAALGDHHFDAVVEWIAFTPGHIETDIELFSGRTPVRLHQLGLGLSHAAARPAPHRIDSAPQSVLAILA